MCKYTTQSPHMLCFYIFLLIFCISDSSPFPSSVPHTFQINFNSLYTTLCEQQTSDQATLLLYTLLHQNANVRTYMLARTDMENLVSIERNLSCVSATPRDLLSFPGGSWCTAGGRSGGAGEPEGREDRVSSPGSPSSILCTPRTFLFLLVPSS